MPQMSPINWIMIYIMTMIIMMTIYPMLWNEHNNQKTTQKKNTYNNKTWKW